ncbi:MAG: sulfotransferase domain-containing protein [Hyphomicrobiales bacterium]
MFIVRSPNPYPQIAWEEIHILNKLKFLFKKYIKKRYRQKTVSVWILSAPKSGRTWLRAMVGIYISKLYGADPSKSLDLRGMSKALRLPLIGLTHNGSDFSNQIVSGDKKLANPKLWKGKKVVHLSRDINDVLVSAFHHMSYRKMVFHGTLSEFIRKPTMGAEKMITAEQKWNKNKDLASDWLDITYEEMQEDPKAVLLKVISFMNLPEDENIAQYAVEFCTAENMRELEKSGFYRHGSMRPSNSGEQGMKVRSAKVGNFKQSLDKTDLEYIQSIIRKISDTI